jgi:ABC-type phosphonate transport system ATPase subunit
MVEAHELTQRYGDKTAVDSISSTIAPGSVTGFLGLDGPLRVSFHERHAGRPAPACGLSSWVTQCRLSSSPTAWWAVRQYPRARVPRPDQPARIPRRPERTG